jgi:hypothetical protein
MEKSILYLGDTSLAEAASYLAGVMSAHDIGFDYLASDQTFESHLLERGPGAVVISDYSSSNFSAADLEDLSARVSEGMGLIMIGGWESFFGAEGEYNRTILQELLPVTMQQQDDRVNCFQPCLVEKARNHAIVETLPFDESPPTVGGFNQVVAKPTGLVILQARRFRVAQVGGEYSFSAEAEVPPLLVVGSYSEGRTCAFTSDVAPHWIGGLVDWGDSRLAAQADGAPSIEVGNWYGQFFANILLWASRQI